MPTNEEDLDLEHQPTQTDVSHSECKTDLDRQPTRNEQFNPEWEPFRDNHELQLNDEEVDGALWFMNPTRAMFTYLGSAEFIWAGQGLDRFISRPDRTYADHSAHTADIQYKWTSRNNRKGRHALVVNQTYEHLDSSIAASSSYPVLRGIWRMATVFAFWNISYITAILFTLAVAVLLVNAALSVISYTNPTWELPSYLNVIEGILSAIGSILFLLSSFLSFVEAVNANRRGCFGWERRHISYHSPTDTTIEHGGATRTVPDWKSVRRTNNFGNLFVYHESRSVDQNDMNSDDLRPKDSGQDKDLWRWFPTKCELASHFIYDLGFVTCSALLLSSTVYTFAGFATLAFLVVNGNVALWVRILQLLAGIGFTVSSILFTLETQTQWHKPQLRVIGWHISFWNTIGSLGLVICAAFAIATFRPRGQWAQYQFVLSFMWGSVGFLIGSLIQWYEALDKHPVQMHRKRERGEK